MNKRRRTVLEDLFAKLSEIHDELECVKEDEENALDNMPESLWSSERYERMQDAVTNLEDALSSLEDVLGYIEAAKE